MSRLIGVVVAAFLALSASSPASAQDKRVALLIGNSDYSHAAALKNPVNDVADLGATLSRIGFSVTTLTNADAEAMKRSIDAFGERAKGADIALVFFAGHAIEADGTHWSIPVDGKVDSLDAVKSQSVNLDRLLASGLGSKLTILLIDTARDNPFAKEAKPAPRQPPKRQAKDASKDQPKSEPAVPAEPQYSMVMYSTRAGARPLDGDGRNSPFAAALLKTIETPGLDLPRLAARVRDELMAATKGSQTPFSYALLPNAEVVLVPR